MYVHNMEMVMLQKAMHLLFFFFLLLFFFSFSFNKPGGVYVLCIYLHTRGELLLETWVFFEFVRFFMQRLTPLFVQIAVGFHSMGDPTIL